MVSVTVSLDKAELTGLISSSWQA